MINADSYYELKKLVAEMRSYLYNDNISDNEIYDIIFPAYSIAVRALIPNFTWYDPDATYLEDVEAFVHAVEEEVIHYETIMNIN